jgi:RimK family alpha-L-glutamate ligase
MRIALLSSGAGWHVRDLLRAAAEAGHAAEAIDFRRVHAALPAWRSSLEGFDAVIVRTMPPGSLEQVVFRMDVLHRLEARGVRVLNPVRALEICIDKFLAAARFDAAGLPTPETVVCQDSEAALEAFDQLGGDVVVKPIFGSEGRGMLRVCNAELAWRTFRTIERTGGVLFLQRFVRHPGWDLRVFVLGGRVLAAMRRYASDDWRTNVAQGGRTERVTPTAEETRLALQAAHAVGTIAAGIDLLPTESGGYVVLEANAVPGWRALAPTAGVDVAAAVIRETTGPKFGA